MTRSSVSADESTIRTYSRCSRASSVSRSSSAMPMMPFIGVRISWLMLARNWLLAWFDASATRRASRSSSLCLRSVMSRETPTVPANWPLPS